MAITAKDVARLRDYTGLGLQDAKRYLTLKERLATIALLKGPNATTAQRIDFLLSVLAQEAEDELKDRFFNIPDQDPGDRPIPFG